MSAAIFRPGFLPEQIYFYLAEYGTLSAPRLVCLTGGKYRSVHNALQMMIQRGIVEEDRREVVIRYSLKND